MLSRETTELIQRIGQRSRLTRNEVDRILYGGEDERQIGRSKKQSLKQYGRRRHDQINHRFMMDVKKSELNQPVWGARKPTEEEKKPKTVRVPKFNKANRKKNQEDEDEDELWRIQAQNFRPSIRPKEQILEEMKVEKERLAREQPPLVRNKRRYANVEKEKAKLQLEFQFKGGKALPGEAMPTPLKGHLPISLITQRIHDKDRLSNAEAKKTQKVEAVQHRKDDLEAQFDAVIDEISSLELKLKTCTTAKAKGAVQAEIARLVHESKTIDELIRDNNNY